jgi:SRSO17 transposase
MRLAFSKRVSILPASHARVENCQIGVFLAYASCHGHTLLDRELYLPKEWIEDQERCRRAGIPDERTFATKPALAQQMLERAFDAGVVLAFLTGDSVYGDDRALRKWLEERRQAYVLAVSGKESVWLHHKQQQIKTILSDLPIEGWERLSAGAGSKGPRWYDWLRVALSDPAQAGWKRWLLVRRSISDPSDVTGYIVFVRAHTTLSELVRVAGMRWTVEESIQTAKGEVGLDHYEVRSWTGWYRHMSLAMWAQAFLTVMRAEEGAEAAPKRGCGILEQRAVWLRSKPPAISHPAKLCRDTAAVLAVGSGSRAQRTSAAALVKLAALASGLGTLLSLSTAREAEATAKRRAGGGRGDRQHGCGVAAP